jgi:hypothetical protein
MCMSRRSVVTNTPHSAPPSNSGKNTVAAQFYPNHKNFILDMKLGVAQNQAKVLKIASRSKSVDGVMQSPVEIVITRSDLERQFASPLHVAAKLLGICATALKW